MIRMKKHVEYLWDEIDVGEAAMVYIKRGTVAPMYVFLIEGSILWH